MRPKKLDSFGVHIFMGRGFCYKRKLILFLKLLHYGKSTYRSTHSRKLPEKQDFIRVIQTRIKRTPELIQGFVLFFYTKLFRRKCKFFVNRHIRYPASCINEYVMIQFTLERYQYSKSINLR